MGFWKKEITDLDFYVLNHRYNDRGVCIKYRDVRHFI
jgi:hypothetical protein